MHNFVESWLQKRLTGLAQGRNERQISFTGKDTHLKIIKKKVRRSGKLQFKHTQLHVHASTQDDILLTITRSSKKFTKCWQHYSKWILLGDRFVSWKPSQCDYCTFNCMSLITAGKKILCPSLFHNIWKLMRNRARCENGMRSHMRAF